MLKKILTIALFIVILYAFGCKKESPQSAPSQQSKTEERPEVVMDFEKYAQEQVTKENMEQQLEKIEDEIKQDVIQTEPNV